MEGKAGTIVGLEQQVVMFLELHMIDPPAPRHAKVKHHRVVSIGVDQPIFRSPAEARHSSASEPLAKIMRERSPKVGAPGFDTADSPSLKHLGKAADGCFDFGKLGH